MRIILALILCLVASVTHAAEKDTQIFDIAGEPGFSDVALSLQMLANNQGTKKDNNFCVIGYSSASGVSAYVLWKEEYKFILWEPMVDQPAQDLTRSRRYLDTRTDVVASEKDMGASTYLVTRAWMDKLNADCAKYGTKYTITKPEIHAP